MQEIAKERCRGKDGTRRHLTDSDRVEQLLLREPGMALDQIGLKEDQQHVSAAKDHGANLHEDEEDGKQGGRSRSDCYTQVSAQKKGANLGQPAGGAEGDD